MNKKLTVMIPQELHIAAKVKAAKTGVSMAEVCRQALAKWVQEDEEEERKEEEK